MNVSHLDVWLNSSADKVANEGIRHQPHEKIGHTACDQLEISFLIEPSLDWSLVLLTFDLA